MQILVFRRILTLFSDVDRRSHFVTTYQTAVKLLYSYGQVEVHLNYNNSDKSENVDSRSHCHITHYTRL